MGSNDIEAVIFDWGGTLTPWHSVDVAQVWRDVAAALGHPDSTAVAAALLAAEELVWIRSRDEHRSGTLDEVCELAQVMLTAAAREVYEAHWEPHTFIDPQAPPMLAGLRERGIRVGVLSNTIWAREHHERVFARDGVLELIDGAVYSSEIPWTKPHPEAFLTAVRAAGATDPSRCVFVGDRLFDDVYGARNVGMRTIFIPHSAIPPSQVGHTVGEPDATISCLSELLPLVDSWRYPVAS